MAALAGIASQIDTGSHAESASLSPAAAARDPLPALSLVARLHHVACEPASLRHALGRAASDEIGTDDLLHAAKHLGLKARVTRSSAERLSLVALPALARLRDGRWVVLAQCDGQRVLLQDAGGERSRPTIEPLDVFAARWTGELILVASRASLAGDLAKFDFSWFVPSLVKYRRLFGEALVVSLFLQLFALVSPLFFQAVMDKVLAHRGLTTLDVLVIGLVIVVVFESVLSALRTYVVDSSLDVVTESANEGMDTVLSLVGWTLGANLEDLVLTGTTAINGTGNALTNRLWGNAAANVLDGAAGADAMQGGAGDDVYRIDNAGDTAVENLAEGVDRVESGVTFTLFANLENLTLTGTATINGIGNELNNLLIGNAAANTLVGGAGNDTLNGGAGSDAMQGGAGNDAYFVDVATDVVTELVGEGTDSVTSAVSLTLAANVENLTLSGTANLNGTGNTLDNVIIGNAGSNTLASGAGNDVLDGLAGSDTMTGGAGDDVYRVDRTQDKVTEAANEGIDRVESTIAWTLGANLENLTLLGTAAVNGNGNALANVLIGNGAANTLAGAEGNDIYDGGAGADGLNDTSATSGDIYRWGAGRGNDAITDAGGSDRIEMGPGVSAAQISLVRATNDLQVRISGAADVLTIKNWYSNAAYRIEEIRLADGSSIITAMAAPASQITNTAVEQQSLLMVDAMSAFTAGDAAATSVEYSKYQIQQPDLYATG